MNTTQAAINSGLKVSSARDDGSTYAIAQNQRGAVAGYAAVTDSLNRATSAVDVALSAGQSISDLLIQLKTKALSAADSSLDTASRQALNQDFVALRGSDHHDREERLVQRHQPGRRFDDADHGPGVLGRHAPHHDLRSEARAFGYDCDAADDQHDLDPDQGVDAGRHHPGRR